MNRNNDPFKINETIFRDIKRQQQMIRDMVQPIRIVQQGISDMTASAMQPFIDQQNQFYEQMASVTKLHYNFSDILRPTDFVCKLGISPSFFKINSSVLKSFDISTSVFKELYPPLPSALKIGVSDIKIGKDWSESIAKVTANIKHLGFLDFGIDNDYFECDETSFPSYTEILESVSTTTSDVYESVEHNKDTKTDEAKPNVIENFKQDIKMIDFCNEVQSVLYYFDKAYFAVDNLPYEFKLELYEKFQTFIIDVFYAGSIALGVWLIKWLLRYLLRDNQKLLDIFKK